MEEDPEFKFPEGGSNVKNTCFSTRSGYFSIALVKTASTSVLIHSPMNASELYSKFTNSNSSIVFIC